MIVEWAHRRLAPRLINLRLINKTRSAGESVTGFEQVAASISQRWAFSLEFNTLRLNMVPSYRAMIASLEGRANALRVPVFDQHFWPSDAVLGLVATVPHSDGTPFGDGSKYAIGDISGVTVTAEKGVKLITVDFGNYGPIFDGGLHFGVEDETYLSTTVTWAGSVATIGFQPSLRQDHTAARFRLRPRLITRLAADEVGEHPLERGLITAPTLELVEILPDELDLLEGGA